MKDSIQKEELISYFRDSQNRDSKIENWFLEKGKTEEAYKLLFSVWEELDSPSNTIQERDDAFNRFTSRLGIDANEPQSNKKKRTELAWWGQKIAAVLFVALLSVSVYLYSVNKNIESVEWIEKSVSYGEMQNITLPDGTNVWLNAGSKIIYPKRFTGNTRQVFLSGEGYWVVAKDKDRPFILKTHDSQVKVLGTEFNLKAYPEDESVTLSLLEGKVDFCTSLQKNPEDRIILTPGNQVVFNTKTQATFKQKIDIESYPMWKDKKFYFKNQPLQEIAKDLERIYNVKIIIRSDAIKKIRYHMAFVNNETLNQVLNAINLDNKLKIKRLHEDVIELY